MISKTVIAAYTFSTLTPLLIDYFLGRYQRKQNDINNNNDSTYHKCKFTSLIDNGQCRQHIYNKVACGEKCSLTILTDIVDFVSSATESLSVCMYLLTSYEICNALLNCYKNGIQVRIIADERMWACTSSQARILQCHGIPVKAQTKDGSMLHHKLFLVDEDTPNAKILLATGNLTLQALCGNWETFIYTDDKKIIARMKAGFEEMWSAFSIYEHTKLENEIKLFKI